MLAAVQLQGADLLGRILDAAALRARDALGAAVSLVGCERIEIDRPRCEGELTFEAWYVRADDGAATITAFVMSRDAADRERIAASGRFTFKGDAARGIASDASRKEPTA